MNEEYAELYLYCRLIELKSETVQNKHESGDLEEADLADLEEQLSNAQQKLQYIRRKRRTNIDLSNIGDNDE